MLNERSSKIQRNQKEFVKLNFGWCCGGFSNPSVLELLGLKQSLTEAAEDDQDDVGEGIFEQEGREKHDDSSLIDYPPQELHQ